MARNVLVLAAATVLSVAVLSSAWAGPAKRYDPGTMTLRELTFEDLRDGYQTFREVCKSCHHRGNDKGASFLYTESKSMRG